MHFSIQVNNQFLAQIFDEALSNAINGEAMEVNSVEVTLNRIGPAKIFPSGKKIELELPLAIHLKRPAGLFTVEGRGSIDLFLSVDFNITGDFRLTTRTTLDKHEWIEKPKLEIGALNIPVETLINLVLNHHESILTAKIDEKLKEFSEMKIPLQKGIADAVANINKEDLKGNQVFADVAGLELSSFMNTGEDLQLKGILHPVVTLNKPISPIDHPSFQWINEENELQDSALDIPVVVPYHLLVHGIKDATKDVVIGGKHLEIDSADFYYSDRLEVQLEISEPIKAQVFVNSTPVFNELEGILSLEDVDVKVNPANFIYKLTAPLVNKFIEKKVEELFPLNLNNQLSSTVKANLPENQAIPNGKANIKLDSIELKALDFEANQINALVRINNLDADIVIQQS